MPQLIRYASKDMTTSLGAEQKQVLSTVSKFTNLTHPAEWPTYQQSRSLVGDRKRQIHLHIGPTNSGKTYNALQRLKQAGSGVYFGPLRLLAWEIFHRLNQEQIACDLVTGEQRLKSNILTSDSDSLHTASTVEMLNLNVRQPYDVAVIDEIQMISDRERGWAWTHALLGVPAKEVHLCGELRAQKLIETIVKQTGDDLHVHKYQRLSPLSVVKSEKTRGGGNQFSMLQPGDALICFSRADIFWIKSMVEQKTSLKCAVVYGSLPAESRAEQAKLFNAKQQALARGDIEADGYDVIIASDAIGMGLNLAVKRVIFYDMKKMNNDKERVELTISQTKQIGGRAGRFAVIQDDSPSDSDTKERDVSSTTKTQKRVQKEAVGGEVTTFFPADFPILRRKMSGDDPQLTNATIQPTFEVVNEFATALRDQTGNDFLLPQILQSFQQFALLSNDYEMANLGDMIKIADIVEKCDRMAKRDNSSSSGALPLKDKWTLTCAPTSLNKAMEAKIFENFVLARCRNERRKLIEFTAVENALISSPGLNAIQRLQMTDMLDDKENVNWSETRLLPPVDEFEIPDPRQASQVLQHFENMHRVTMLYMWLHYRLPSTFVCWQSASFLKLQLEEILQLVLSNSCHQFSGGRRKFKFHSDENKRVESVQVG
ncbi:hypothetical protein MP228_003384 [Amoeboaphelidium protococcarum]|nr:hypothetical protein MP228_003384 [Amoeboaphelidium protococcarum]